MPGRKPTMPDSVRLFDPAPIPGGRKESDEYYTPAWVFDALGIRFDMDVASPPGGLPWVPADVFVDEPQDGLATPWVGTVWCNPPYSEPRPWVAKMHDHRDGVMLLPSDTGTTSFHDHVVRADALCFVKGRLAFVAADGVEQPSWTARFPSVLAGWGEVGRKAVAGCGLGWVVEARKESPRG